ncbi:tol-pal system YbgF family protein [candidate division KSB1 bacterium]
MKLHRSILIFLLISLIFSFISCSKKSEEEIYSEAKALSDGGEFMEALALFEELVEDYPDGVYRVESLFQLAAMYDGLNYSEKSIETYKQIADEFPDHEKRSKAIFMIGFIYANQVGDLINAEKYYKQLLSEYPDDELTSSAEFELEFLGKNPDEIDNLLLKRIEAAEKKKAIKK